MVSCSVGGLVRLLTCPARIDAAYRMEGRAVISCITCMHAHRLSLDTSSHVQHTAGSRLTALLALLFVTDQTALS